MIVNRLKNKLLFSVVTISLLITVAFMLAVSMVIRQQHQNQSNALLHKASNIIGDSLTERSNNLLAASRQLAAQKNLGSTIWYLAKYARSDFDRETLFNTYQQLVRDISKIGSVAKASRVAIYDMDGHLISFALFDPNRKRVGFVEHAPRAVFQVATLDFDEDISQKNLQPGNSVAGIGLEFGRQLPKKESVHYAVVDGQLSIESHVPIQDEAFEPAAGKPPLKQVGLVVMTQSLSNKFVDQLSQITDTSINVFTSQGFASGNLAAYKTPDWGMADRSSPGKSFNEITVAGMGYYQCLMPLYSHKEQIGTISALYSKEIVRRNTSEMIQTLAWIGLASMLLVFPLTWYFASSISKPLTILSSIFRDVASSEHGNALNERFNQLKTEEKRGDELGDLTQSFIAMNDAVNQKIQQINEINASLEHKVLERTAALASSEQALRQTKAILQAAMDQSPAGIAIANAPDGQLLYVNDAGLLVRGSDRQSIVNGIGIDQYVASWKVLDFDGTPLRSDEVPLTRAILFGETNSREFIIRRSEGEDRIVMANAAPIKDDTGKITGGVVVFSDITEQRQVEKEIQKSQEKYRLLFQNQPVGFALHEIILDSNGKPFDYRFLEINPAFEKLTGLKASDLIGKTQLEVMPNSEPYWAETYGHVALTGETTNFTNFSMELNKHFQVSAYSPEPGKFATLFLDITESKKAEQELLDAKEFLELTQRSAGAGLWAWDFTAGNLTWSPEQYQMFGLDPSAAGAPTFDLWRSVVHPDDLKVAESAIRDAVRDRTQLFNEYRIIKQSGEVRWVNDIGQLNYDSLGEPRRMSGICLDITGRKKVEEERLMFEHQLQHTQKLESLGVLSGGIAHDFNNILAIIVGYCSLIKINYKTAEKNIPEIEKAAERGAGLCRQMLAYAGKAQLAMSLVDMGSVVKEMVTMLKSTLPQNAEIKTHLPSDIPIIVGDSSQIRQIIMNLIINASEAIGNEHGEIRVVLATTTITAGQTEHDYNGNTIPSGEYVCLEVTDNGSGMDEETKWRLFEPFYTTKFTGRGLGMSAVLGIIKSHGGALQLFSQQGKGATFKVYLPVPTRHSSKNEGQKPSLPSAPWLGSGKILLVEDEDQVRLTAQALLENFGFTVLAAVNGKEALELYQRNATDITLVMTDLGMPVMDGYELLSELKKLNQELPIIVSSGYGDSEVISRIATDTIAGLISKPYSANQLQEVLKRVLETG